MALDWFHGRAPCYQFMYLGTILGQEKDFDTNRHCRFCGCLRWMRSCKIPSKCNAQLGKLQFASLFCIHLHFAFAMFIPPAGCHLFHSTGPSPKVLVFRFGFLLSFGYRDRGFSSSFFAVSQLLSSNIPFPLSLFPRTPSPLPRTPRQSRDS